MGLRRYETAIFVCAIIATLAIEAKISNSIAAEAITQLKTSSGLLVARQAIGRDCGPKATLDETCKALYLNDKVILAEHDLGITAVFPSNNNPLLVSIGTWTGGNACCGEDYILDFTKTPPLKLKGFGFGSDISRTKSGVVFQMFAGWDALGDELVGTYSYELGSGQPVKIRAVPVHKSSPLESKERSDDILADPMTRAPILNLIGKDQFAKFRSDMGISDPLRKIDGNVILGSGCMPHGCSSDYSMFVIDVIDNLAWAVEGEEDATGNPTVRIWGVLTPNDVVPLREIRGWLAQHRVPQWKASFVPLPDSVAQLYKRPRKTVAKIEAPQSLSESKTQDAPMRPNLPQPPSGEHLAIPLQKEGGTFVVAVSINGQITLKFTIDSGAADVSIPADVVMTLLRTGTLTREDFLGTQTYRLADGSTVPSQTFRIRSLKVGDRVVENVTGSVASVAGTLLLGQSFLSRFKSWSIDNQRQVLLLD